MYLIAIDGGGTKTDLVLFEHDGTVRCKITGSASCPTSLGLDASFTTTAKLICRLIKKAGVSTDDIFALYAGIAGCGVASIGNAYTEKLQAEFRKIPFISCGSDVLSALNCGLSNDNGMALICGTGSSLLVRSGNNLHQVGGWGYLLGDEGSGYDFGRMGLKAALEAYDGRGRQTMLSQMLKDALGMPVHNSIDKIYEGGKRLISSFAPIVLHAAAQGDTVATDILNQATNKLCKMLIAGSHYIERPKYRTVLVGGIWNAENNLLQNSLQERLTEDFELIRPQQPPVYGAAVQALRISGLSLPVNFSEKFSTSLYSLPKG